MKVSILTFVIMILSALLVTGMPFLTLLVRRDKEKKKFPIFLWGFLFFLASLIIYTVLWNLIDTDSVITKLLGTDTTVKVINSVILDIVKVTVETFVVYFACRWFMKKDDNPARPVHFAGGYALADSIYVIVLLILSVVAIVVDARGGKFSFTLSPGVVIAADNLDKSKIWEYLFKVLIRLMNLSIYTTGTFMIYTGRKHGMWWLYFIAAILHLGIDLPYSMCALETVWYWRNTAFTTVVMLLVTAIAFLVTAVLYKNYYGKKKNKE